MEQTKNLEKIFWQWKSQLPETGFKNLYKVFKEGLNRFYCNILTRNRCSDDGC